MSNTKREKKKPIEEKIRKGLKHSAGFTWTLLINVLIVYIVIKLFSYSFNFAYSVFADVACDPSSKEYIVIEIPADSSSLDIGKTLEDRGIIENKYVFMAKVRIKKYGNLITPGKYGLSASMTYDEIIDVICHIEKEEEE